MKVLGTGLSGLVGSRIIELLGNKYQFENLSLSTGVDITEGQSVMGKVKASNAPFLLHLAAKTDVDGCEKDKHLGENGDAWKVNVLGTKNIVEACLQTGKRLIYISTDFVFDGKKDHGYTEEDSPNPINWYAKTKYEGEKIIQNSNLQWLIIRIAYPYRANFPKKDFVRNMVDRLKSEKDLLAVTDHIMTPTFIDDLADALDVFIEGGHTGIFHVVGSQFVSPFEAALLIAKTFNFDQSAIKKTTREEFFKDRAPRPLYLGLRNDKIEKLGIKMKTFEEGLMEVKRQIVE